MQAVRGKGDATAQSCPSRQPLPRSAARRKKVPEVVATVGSLTKRFAWSAPRRISCSSGLTRSGGLFRLVLRGRTVYREHCALAVERRFAVKGNDMRRENWRNKPRNGAIS